MVASLPFTEEERLARISSSSKGSDATILQNLATLEINSLRFILYFATE